MTLFVTVIFIFVLNQAYTLIYDIEKYNLFMPNVQPKQVRPILHNIYKINS